MFCPCAQGVRNCLLLYFMGCPQPWIATSTKAQMPHSDITACCCLRTWMYFNQTMRVPPSKATNKNILLYMHMIYKSTSPFVMSSIRFFPFFNIVIQWPFSLHMNASHSNCRHTMILQCSAAYTSHSLWIRQRMCHVIRPVQISNRLHLFIWVYDTSAVYKHRLRRATQF